MHRIPLLPALVLLTACPPETPTPDPIGVWEDPGAPTDFLVASATEAAPARVVVRAVNEWRAAVPADTVEIVVDGVAQVVQFDDVGFGVLEVPQPGVHVAIAQGNVVDIVVLDSATPLEAPPSAAAMDTLTEVFPAAGGALGYSATSAWWIPAGGTPIEVLRAPEGRTLDGMSVGHVDADGVADAIVWSADTVAVLRGHALGGYAWVGSISASDRVIGGAALSDADDDGVTDIVVGWTSTSRHELEVWHGDGQWGFDPVPPVRLRRPPHSISLGDNTGERRPQITILDDSDFWTRFVVSGTSWALTGPVLTEFTFLEFSQAYSADFNGGDGDELFIIAPYVQNNGRNLIMFDLASESIQVTQFDPIGARFAFTDSDRDGRADIWFLDSSRDLYQRKNPGDGQLQRRVYSPPEQGLIAATDTTGDRVPELFVAGPTHWQWTFGGLGAFDTGTWWTPGEQELSFDFSLALPAIPTELDDQAATSEFVGVSQVGADVSLKVWSLFPGPTPVTSVVGEISVTTDGTEPLDLALCGRSAYVLNTAGVSRFDFVGASPALVASASTTGSRVVCGAGPSGAAVAVLDAGQVWLYDADLTLLTTQPAAGVEALALVDGALETCDVSGCDVVGWDYGDGIAVVTSTPDGLAIDNGVDDVLTFGAGGRLFVQDIDGDGLDDLLAHDQGTVVVVRSAGDGFGVDRVVGTSLVFDGAVGTVDAKGSGTRTLVGTRDGALVVSSGYTPVPSDTNP